MCMIFGSILYRIGGEQSMDVHRTDGKFHFSPCVIIAMLEDTLTRARSQVGEDCYTQTHLPCYNPEILVSVKSSNHWVYVSWDIV